MPIYQTCMAIDFLTKWRPQLASERNNFQVCESSSINFAEEARQQRNFMIVSDS